MWNYIWPVLLVVGANTFYHICSKSTPDNVQPFATLMVTYLVSAALCLVLFFVTSPDKNLFAAWKQVNWTTAQHCEHQQNAQTDQRRYDCHYASSPFVFL